MSADKVIYWLIYFAVTVLIAWIVLSVILAWFRPVLYNSDGSVNWWTTLWVAALIIVFAWLLLLLISWLIGLFMGMGACDPCAQQKSDPRVWNWW